MSSVSSLGSTNNVNSSNGSGPPSDPRLYDFSKDADSVSLSSAASSNQFAGQSGDEKSHKGVIIGGITAAAAGLAIFFTRGKWKPKLKGLKNRKGADTPETSPHNAERLPKEVRQKMKYGASYQDLSALPGFDAKSAYGEYARLGNHGGMGQGGRSLDVNFLKDLNAAHPHLEQSGMEHVLLNGKNVHTDIIPKMKDISPNFDANKGTFEKLLKEKRYAEAEAFMTSKDLSFDESKVNHAVIKAHQNSITQHRNNMYTAHEKTMDETGRAKKSADEQLNKYKTAVNNYEAKEGAGAIPNPDELKAADLNDVKSSAHKNELLRELRLKNEADARHAQAKTTEAKAREKRDQAEDHITGFTPFEHLTERPAS
jgi:hypothetical protein